MRRFFTISILTVVAILVLILASMTGFTQQTAAPQLTTTERVALQSCEKSKQEAEKLYNDAVQQELAIMREWQIAHPGFHLDPRTLAVEADPPKPEVKPALPAKK
jgi:hypothetical protein